MPTGYTHYLLEKSKKEKVSLTDFALQCARAFGALISLNEDSLGGPIPERIEPDPFYAIELEKARKALAEAESWGDERWEEERLKSLEHMKDRLIEQEKEKGRARAVLEEMLKKVKKWDPPIEHLSLKRFMIEQIEITIPEESDRPCSILSCANHKKSTLDSLKGDAAYWENKWKKEVARASSRNEWLQQLRKSLAEAEG
jgi:hypothetical protein